MPAWLPYLPHPEWLVLALMAGLYLYESVCLLAPNELLLIRRRSWHHHSGNRGFALRGRHPALPGWRDFYRPAFRLAWQLPGQTGPLAAAPMPAALDALQRLALPTLLLTVAVLWLALTVPGGNLDLIAAALVSYYLLALATLGYLYYLRRALGLTGGQVVSLGVEILCCPPFAPNLVRRLSLAQPLGHDALLLAARLLPPAEWQQLAGNAAGVMQQLLDFDEIAPQDRAAAARLLRALQGEAS